MSELKKKYELKRVAYKGFAPQGRSDSEVVYMVIGNQILFSATEDCVHKVTSTINAAESIVKSIAEAEGINWQDYTFYDVQTAIGYPHHGEDYLCIDQLTVEPRPNGWLNVSNWQPVAMSEGHARERGINLDELAIYPDMVAPFKRLASGE